jgi:tetratricopeptide (TPR) repeat protein
MTNARRSQYSVLRTGSGMSILSLFILIWTPALLAQEKIKGPYQWMLLPVQGKCAADSIAQDQIAQNAAGMSEAEVASGKLQRSGRPWKEGTLCASSNNMNELMNGLGLGKGDNPGTAAYGMLRLQSDTLQNAMMRVGSDDSIRVYMNGELVHENPAMRGASDFQEEFPVTLKAGANTLLLKVVNCGGGFSVFAGIQAAFRVNDQTYRPLPDAPGQQYENALAARLFREARNAAANGNLSGAIPMFERAEREAPGNAMYTFGYGYDLLHKGRPEAAVSVLKRALARGYRPTLTRAHIALALTRLDDPAAVLAWQDCIAESGAPNADKSPEAQKDAAAIRFYCAREKARLETNLDLQAAQRTLRFLEEVRPAEDQNLTGAVLRTGIGYVWLDEGIAQGFAKTAAGIELGLGHLDLAAGKFEKASAHYTAARNAAAPVPADFKDVDFNSYIQIAELCKKYAAARPVRVLKVASFLIPRVQGTFDFPDGKRTADNRLTPRMRNLIGLNEALLKRFLEAHSKGRLSAEFDRIELNSTLRRLQWSGEPADASRTPSLESLDPAAGEEIMQQARTHDAHIYYWNGEGISTSANGGSATYPYIPYYLYSPIRGYMQIPANWLSANSLPLMVHEFFHMRDGTVENARQAGHCSTDRGRFGDFKGSCENPFAYYVYHMEKTSEAQWLELQYLERFPHGEMKHLLDTLKSTIRASPESLAEARKNIEAGNESFNKKDLAEAEKDFRRALTIVTEHQEALSGLAKIASERGAFGEAFELHVRRLAGFPDSYGNFSAGWLLHRKLGRPLDALAHYERARDLRTDTYHFLEASLHAGIVVRDTRSAEEGIGILAQCEKEALLLRDSFFAGRCVLEIAAAHGELLKNREKALQEVRRAIALGYNTDHSRWYLERYTNAAAARSSPPEPAARPGPASAGTISRD